MTRSSVSDKHNLNANQQHQPTVSETLSPGVSRPSSFQCLVWSTAAQAIILSEGGHTHIHADIQTKSQMLLITPSLLPLSWETKENSNVPTDINCLPFLHLLCKSDKMHTHKCKKCRQTSQKLWRWQYCKITNSAVCRITRTFCSSAQFNGL